MFLRDPLVLLLLPVLFLLVWFVSRAKDNAALRFSSGELLSGITPSFKIRLSRNFKFIRLFSCVLIVLALARPQSPIADAKVETEGIDIVLAVDTSTSMLAEDFQVAGRRQSRIEIIKNVVKDFIKGRSNDRIAVVAFAARAYTVCPLTLDYPWLLSNLERIKAGMIEDGTAIGSGIASSLNRLRNTKAKSRVIILLTDGRNNTGDVAPLTAAEAAAALKVKIYTIGAGSKGPIPYPVRDIFGNVGYQYIQADLDEDMLSKIAQITHAKYFRATDTESLKKIYQEIDRMEKAPIEERGYQEYKELFGLFLIPGLILLLGEIILANTLLRKIP